MSKGFVQIFILNVLEYLDSSSKSRVYQSLTVTSAWVMMVACAIGVGILELL